MNPAFESIGAAFIKAYYEAYDNSTTQEERALKLKEFYHPDALFTFEDSKLQGRETVMERIKNLGFTLAAHAITKADFQPTLDGGVLIMVTGQLRVDQDRPFGFSQVFQLSHQDERYFIMHEIFRLAIHDFDAQQQQ